MERHKSYHKNVDLSRNGTGRKLHHIHRYLVIWNLCPRTWLRKTAFWQSKSLRWSILWCPFEFRNPRCLREERRIQPFHEVVFVERSLSKTLDRRTSRTRISERRRFRGFQEPMDPRLQQLQRAWRKWRVRTRFLNIVLAAKLRTHKAFSEQLYYSNARLLIRCKNLNLTAYKIKVSLTRVIGCTSHKYLQPALPWEVSISPSVPF